MILLFAARSNRVRQQAVSAVASYKLKPKSENGKKVQRLEENIASLDVRLTPDEIREIETAIPADAVAGSRYATPQMAHVYQRS